MKDHYTTIVVDDEENSLHTLLNILQQHCPELHIVDHANCAVDAIRKIDQYKPDLVFLDIQLPNGDGFRVLQKVTYKNFDVVFTTAYEHYAIQAFDVAAVHYILKPIRATDIIQAVERFKKKQQKPISEQLQHLQQAFQKPTDKLSLPIGGGIEILEVKDIILCEADGNYTYFHTVFKDKVMVSKNLQHYEALLKKNNFCRIHNKYLINLAHVSRYSTKGGNVITLSNGHKVQVSFRRKQEFVAALNCFTQRGLD